MRLRAHNCNEFVTAVQLAADNHASSTTFSHTFRSQFTWDHRHHVYLRSATYVQSRILPNQARILTVGAVYVKGKHLSYQRGKRNTNPNTSLLKIEGVEDPKAAQYE